MQSYYRHRRHPASESSPNCGERRRRWRWMGSPAKNTGNPFLAQNKVSAQVLYWAKNGLPVKPKKKSRDSAVESFSFLRRSRTKANHRWRQLLRRRQSCRAAVAAAAGVFATRRSLADRVPVEGKIFCTWKMQSGCRQTVKICITHSSSQQI